MSFSRKGKLLVNVIRMLSKNEVGFVQLLKSLTKAELGVIQKSFSKYIAKNQPGRVFNDVQIHLLMDSKRLAKLSKNLLNSINTLTIKKEGSAKPSHSHKGLDVFYIANDKDKKNLEAIYNEILVLACDLLDSNACYLDPGMLERLGFKKDDSYFADPEVIHAVLISYFESVQGLIIAKFAENREFYASPRNMAAGLYFSKEYKVNLNKTLNALLTQRLEKHILKECGKYKAASAAEKNILVDLRTGKDIFSDRLELAFRLSHLGGHAKLKTFLEAQRTLRQLHSRQINLIAPLQSESKSEALSISIETPVSRGSQSDIASPLSPASSASTTSEESEASSFSSRGSWSVVEHTDTLVARKLQDTSESKHVEELLSDSPYFLVSELTESVVDVEVEESALSPHVALSSFSPKKESVLVSWDKEEIVSSSLTLT